MLHVLRTTVVPGTVKPKSKKEIIFVCKKLNIELIEPVFLRSYITVATCLL